MRRWMLSLLTMVTLPVLVSCEEPPPATPPDAPPPATAPEPERDPFDGIDRAKLSNLPEIDPATAAEARRRLDAVVASTRAAGGIIDTAKTTIVTPQGPIEVENWLQCGPGSDAEYIHKGWRYVTLDETFYVEREDIPGRYLVAPMTGSITESVATIGLPVYFPPHFAIRGTSGIDAAVALTPTLMRDPRVAGWRTVDDDGTAWDEILIIDPSGWALVRVDPELELVNSVTYIGHPPTAPFAHEFRMHVQFDPTVYDALPQPIVFEPGDREVAADFDSLALGSSVTSEVTDQRARIGDLAHDFRLPTLDGETVTLSGLRGSVVVLDFWATWCGPCKRGLPLLSDFTKWAEDSGQPIEVFAVDLWERLPTNDEKRDAVATYWRAQNFAMDTILDHDDTLAPAFGLDMIPTTVVIGPDGRVNAIHRGFEADIVERLKRDVLAALGRPG